MGAFFWENIAILAVAVVAVAITIGVRPLVSVVGKQVRIFSRNVIAVAVAVAVRPLSGFTGEGIGLVSVGVIAVAVLIAVKGLCGVVGEGIGEIVNTVLVAVKIEVANFGIGRTNANGEELSGKLGDGRNDVARCGEGLQHGEVGLVDERCFSLLGADDVHAVVAVDGGRLFGMPEAETGCGPCVGIVMIQRATGGAGEKGVVVKFDQRRDNTVWFGKGVGQTSIAVVNVDFLIVGGNGYTAVMENFESRYSRGDGGAAHTGESAGVVLVSPTLSSKVNQPQFALIVQDGVIDGVRGCDVPVHGLCAHLDHIHAVVMGHSDQFLCIIKASIVCVNLEKNGPLRGENAVVESVHTHVPLVVNRENAPVVQRGPQDDWPVQTVRLPTVG